MGISWDAVEPSWPVALARGDKGHLAAYQIGMGSDAFLSLALVDSAWLVQSVIKDVACASAPFATAAAPVPGGFVVATASGCPPNDPPVPATELQIFRLDEITWQLEFGFGIPHADPLAHIAAAESPGGAWIVWQSDGSSAEAPPPIMATRVDEKGVPVVGTFKVTAEGQSWSDFAASSFGSMLAVAWIDAIDPSTPNLRIDLFDSNGTFVTGTSVNTAPSFLFDPTLSLRASPDGTSLLLAWSDVASTDPATVRVARFSCAGGL
ncbi:MAG: hypothetical protein QM820_32995 [Minicystis sp.]